MPCSEKLVLDCGRRQRDLSWYEDLKAGSYFTCRSLPSGILNGYLYGSVMVQDVCSKTCVQSFKFWIGLCRRKIQGRERSHVAA